MPKVDGAEDPFKTDEGFLRYVSLHSDTPRALFHIDHVNRLLRLAGEDEIEKRDGDPEGIFITLRSYDAEPLVRKAHERLGHK